MNRRLLALLALIGVHGHLSAEQKHDLANAAQQAAQALGMSARELDDLFTAAAEVAL